MSSQNNIIIAYENTIDDATLSGGNWTLPLDNLRNIRLRGKPARCANNKDLTSSVINIDLGRIIWTRVVALCAHTLGIDSAYKLTFWEDDPATSDPVHVTEWLEVFPPIYDPDQLEWESDNFWTGKPTEKQIAGFTPSTVWFDKVGVIARYIRIEIDDRLSARDYFDIGYLFTSAGFQPVRNFSWGRRTNYNSRSVVNYTPAGVAIIDQRAGARSGSLALEYMPETDAQVLFDGLRMLDRSKPLLILPNPAVVKDYYREVYLSLLTEDVSMANMAYKLWSVELSFSEVIG